MAFRNIHFPASAELYRQAIERLKFEELFIAQVRLNLVRLQRHVISKGVVFEKVGDYFNTLYAKYLPFQLTGAQKSVLKEIRTDTGRGRQMNRLLQGDVGSGKTIVALLSMLLAADNGYQSCFMAPTEILAQQHFTSLSKLLKEMPVELALLTGSTKTKERKRILQGLLDDTIHFVVGTHAVIEDVVQFKNLGLVIVDEQHRFGRAGKAVFGKAVDRRIGLDQLLHPRDDNIAEAGEHRLGRMEAGPEVGPEVGDRVKRNAARVQGLDQFEAARDRAGQALVEAAAPCRDERGMAGIFGGALGHHLRH
jgi:RecG-like helicase